MKQHLKMSMVRMSEEEKYAAIYRDVLTGLHNRTAFELECPNYVLIADLDSLKYINDTHGHRVGDIYLQDLGEALVEVFGDGQVFRLHKDEFAVIAHRKEGLELTLIKLQLHIPGFSFGCGNTLDEADADLQVNKAYRLAWGYRAARGVQPPWEIVTHFATK